MSEEGKRAWGKRLQMKKHSKRIKKHARSVERATMRHAHRFLVNRWDKIREIRLHIILWLGGVGLLIALVGLQMLWFQRSYITQAPVSGGTYAEAVKGPIATLNPLFATTPAELSASHLLFSSLFKNDTTGHLRGDLATSMKNENNKVFTVKLRRDARWHDGKPLNATDVTYTVGLMKNPSVRAVNASSWQGIDARQLDDYTVQFTLPAAYAAFPQALTFPILPQHVLKTINPSALRENSFSTSPIGSGPFSLRLLQVINASNGRRIVHLDANHDFYDGSPRLERFQIHSFNDDDGMARALRTGEVSAASDVSSSTAKTIDTDRYEIVTRPVNSGVYAIFNIGQSPALKDLNVRRALQIGTDTAQIRKELFGNPRRLDLPFVMGQVEGTNTVTIPKPNKSEAIKLLESSGWVMQNGVRTKGQDRLNLRVVTRRNADFELALQELAGQWRQLGIDVDTQVVGASDFTQDILQLRNYDVLLDKLVIGGDPDVFAYWHSRGLLNFSSYNNQTSDDALTSARTISDNALRAVKYVAFARQWIADVPAIGLYQPSLIYAHSKSARAVDQVETVISPDDHYANVRYWTAEIGRVYKTP